MLREIRTLKELVKFYKGYQDYLKVWNKRAEKQDRPIPIGGVYGETFKGFMDYLIKLSNKA